MKIYTVNVIPNEIRYELSQKTLTLPQLHVVSALLFQQGALTSDSLAEAKALANKCPMKPVKPV